VFDRIGGFDESLVKNQDFEFNHRLIQSGGKIYLTPEIKSTYYARGNLRKLFKQYLYYGYYKFKVVKNEISAFKYRYQIPPLFITLLFLLLVGSIFYPKLGMLLGGILIFYFLFISLSSVMIALKEGIKYLPFLPLVFISLHFGFGFGFIASVMHFIFSKFQGLINTKLRISL